MELGEAFQVQREAGNGDETTGRDAVSDSICGVLCKCVLGRRYNSRLSHACRHIAFQRHFVRVLVLHHCYRALYDNLYGLITSDQYVNKGEGPNGRM